MYRSVTKIADLMGISRQSVRNIKKIIAAHPERYGLYGVAGRLISVVAFVDAMRWRDAIETGYIDDLPPFDPEEVAKNFVDLPIENGKNGAKWESV